MLRLSRRFVKDRVRGFIPTMAYLGDLGPAQSVHGDLKWHWNLKSHGAQSKGHGVVKYLILSMH